MKALMQLVFCFILFISMFSVEYAAYGKQNSSDYPEDLPDPISSVNTLRKNIRKYAENGTIEELLKNAERMISHNFAKGRKPNGEKFYYLEETYYLLGKTFETIGKRNEDVTLENPESANDAQYNYLQSVHYYITGYKEFPDSYYSAEMLFKIGELYLTKLFSMADAHVSAAEYFKEYVERFPSHSDAERAHYYLGMCLFNIRRFTEAVNSFQTFILKYPQSEYKPDVLFYEAAALYNLGRLNESLDGFETFIKQYPGNRQVPEAYYTKAWVYLDLDRETESIPEFQYLVNNYPESEFAPPALFSIGEYYFASKHHDEAKAAFKSIVEKYPTSHLVGKAKERLHSILSQ